MKKSKLIREINQWRVNSTNVRFQRLCTIAIALGFKFSRQHGSHKIYVLESVKEILDLQDIGGRAKSYQVKQFIDLVDKYNLLEGDDDV